MHEPHAVASASATLARMLRRSIRALAVVLAVTATSNAALAEGSYVWRAPPGEEHGSQVASSEWLPIVIGGSAGVIVGALAGTAFDNHQPPVIGALAGATFGAFAGGGGGAWVIRTLREQDTKWAGAVTGGAIGAGVGVILFNEALGSEGTATKVGGAAALVLLPVMGILAGRSLAIHFGGDRANKEAPRSFVMQPNVVPVAAASGSGPAGLTFGVSGTFF